MQNIQKCLPSNEHFIWYPHMTEILFLIKLENNILVIYLYTRGYQKVRRLMQWYQYLLSYAYKICWE